MRYVYLLESVAQPARRYVGRTRDFRKRIAAHNAGQSPHTRKHRPWRAVVVIRFEDDDKAEAFELYLKNGSGHAFARRHFW
jgi:predicted GIY-YIG superfamily endonuclease